MKINYERSQPSPDTASPVASSPPSSAKQFSIKIVVKGRCPSWNQVLDINPFLRKNLRHQIQDDVLLASKSSVAALPIPATTASSIISTLSATLAFWRTTMMQRTAL